MNLVSYKRIVEANFPWYYIYIYVSFARIINNRVQLKGKLVKVTNILGFGSPKPNTIAVRFNAQFQKGGMGRQAIPMPFGLGQTNKSEGRGVMVGQVG